jgi:glycosyltransferase involved in cell wall biosynthesis
MKHRKRIAAVSLNRFNTFLCDGVSNSTLELLKFLQGRGHEVAILTFFTREPYRRRAFAHLAARRPPRKPGYSAVIQGVPIYQELLPFGESEVVRNSSSFLAALASRLREEGVEFALSVEDDYLTLFAVSALALPGAHFFHSLAYVQDYRQSPFFLKLLTRRPVFAGSDFLRQNIRSRLGLEVEVWHPLFDPGRYRVSRDKARTRDFGFYAAGWHKGQAVVNRLTALLPDRTFVLIGRGYERSRGGAPPNVEAWGDVTDPPRFYGRIRLLLVPSLVEEGFSRVILEAAVNGIPVLSNRIGGIPEAIGSSGLLFDVDPARMEDMDLDVLADAYRREAVKILDDRRLYESLGRRARARAEEYAATQQGQCRRHYDRYFTV